MERRAFIATGAAAAATGLAGCMGDDGTGPGNGTDGNGNDGSPPGDGEEPVTVTGTDFTVRSRGEATADATPSYWHRDGALHVRGVIAGSDACKTARLADASYDADRDAIVVQIDTVDADDAGDMCAQVITPIEYEATVRYEGPRPDLVLEHDGEEVAADRMASDGTGPNELTATGFNVTGAECGEQTDEIDVERDEDGAALAVDGVIWGPDACTRAELNYASYDADDDVLVTDVGTTRTDDEVCADCITEVSYRLDADFSRAPAGDVAMSHDGVRLGGLGERVDQASFEIRDHAGDQETGDVAADFDADAGTVTVEGVVQGRDGCASARLAGAQVRDGTLHVDVETVDTRAPDEACTEALIDIAYRGTVHVDGDLPGRVVVAHDGTDETTIRRE